LSPDAFSEIEVCQNVFATRHVSLAQSYIKIAFSAGASPRIQLGSSQRSLRPLAEFQRREREMGEGREGKGRKEREGREGFGEG